MKTFAEFIALPALLATVYIVILVLDAILNGAQQ